MRGNTRQPLDSFTAKFANTTKEIEAYWNFFRHSYSHDELVVDIMSDGVSYGFKCLEEMGDLLCLEASVIDGPYTRFRPGFWVQVTRFGGIKLTLRSAGRGVCYAVLPDHSAEIQYLRDYQDIRISHQRQRRLGYGFIQQRKRSFTPVNTD